MRKIFAGLAVAGLVLIIAEYQNCAPTSNAQFGLGTAASTLFTLSAVTMSANTYTPSAAFTASATVTASVSGTSSSLSTVVCQWNLYQNTSIITTYPTTPISGTTCTLTGGVAPANIGNYQLGLLAYDTIGDSANSTGSLIVTAPTPTPGGQCATASSYCGSSSWGSSCTVAATGTPPEPAFCTTYCCNGATYTCQASSSSCAGVQLCNWVCN